MTDPMPPLEHDLIKLWYQVQLDMVKADHGAAIAVDKAILDASLEQHKRDELADFDREKADWANEFAQAQAANSAYLDVAKGSFNRAMERATFLQGASTALSGAYAAILGLSFALDTNDPLPARGLVPAVFVGLALFLTTTYVSFLPNMSTITVDPSDGTLSERQRRRRNQFLLWMRAVQPRRHLLQGAVFSLGIGAVTLPLPFLEVPDDAALGAGAILLVILLVVVWLYPLMHNRAA